MKHFYFLRNKSTKTKMLISYNYDNFTIDKAQKTTVSLFWKSMAI